MSRVLHIVPGTSDVTNGMVVVANLLAKEQGNADVVDLNYVMDRINNREIDEVWVHGMWLPKEWAVCRNVLKSGKRLVRMTHGSLSPIYLKHQSPLKKWLVGPIERHFLSKADKVIATCKAESDWIHAYEPKVKSIEITNLKRFFNLANTAAKKGQNFSPKPHPLHLLYLGRQHPLKGLDNLFAALRQFAPNIQVQSENLGQTYILTWESESTKCSKDVELKVVSNAFGDELEKVWAWCDVLILPTLSDNFGLVIAEALERGKRVITTDGASAWGDGNDYGGRLTYIKGYRDGTRDARVRLLAAAIRNLAKSE